MPRCCVPGCDTGTGADIVRTRNAGARNKSTFLLPGNYRLFRKWENILNLDYDTINQVGGRVCELHFNEDDIIRHYYKKMENDKVQKFRFSRPTLKKGVIPLSIPRQEDLSACNQQTRKYKKKKIPKAEDIENDVAMQPHDMKKEVSIEDYDSPMNNRLKSDIRKQVEREISIEDCDSPMYKKLKSDIHKQVGRAISVEDYDSPMYKRLKSDIRKRVGEIFKTFEKKNCMRPIKRPRNKFISTPNKKRRLSFYDFDGILQNLKRKNCRVPKGWQFSIKDEDTVEFVYSIERKSSQKKSLCTFLTCIFERETFVEIKAFHQKVSVNFEFKFLSYNDLLENLIDLQRVRCCEGIIGKRFAKNCKGFILPCRQKYQRLGNFGKCSVCNKLWNNKIRKPRRVKKVKFLHLRTSKGLKFKADIRKFLKKQKKLKKMEKKMNAVKKSKAEALKKSLELEIAVLKSCSNAHLYSL